MSSRTYGYNPYQTKPMPVPVVGVWRRFFASAVDSILMSLVGALMLALGFFIAYDSNPNASLERLIFEFDSTTWVLNGASILIAIIYYVGCWSMGGQTLGKWLLGIKVVSDEGGSPSLPAAVLRYLGYLVNNIFFSLGFLAIAFDKRKQGWHDKMASTFVVPASVEVPPGVEPVFVYPSDSNLADTFAVILYVLVVCVLPFVLAIALSLYMPQFLNELDPARFPLS